MRPAFERKKPSPLPMPRLYGFHSAGHLSLSPYRPIAMRHFLRRITSADRGKRAINNTIFQPLREKIIFWPCFFSDSRRVWDVAKSDVPLCVENQRKYQYCRSLPFLIFGPPRRLTFHAPALPAENKKESEYSHPKKQIIISRK